MNITKPPLRNPQSEIQAAIRVVGKGLDPKRLRDTALNMQKNGEFPETLVIHGLPPSGEKLKEFAPLGGKTGAAPLSKEFQKELNGHRLIDRS